MHCFVAICVIEVLCLTSFRDRSLYGHFIVSVTIRLGWYLYFALYVSLPFVVVVIFGWFLFSVFTSSIDKSR